MANINELLGHFTHSAEEEEEIIVILKPDVVERKLVEVADQMVRNSLTVLRCVRGSPPVHFWNAHLRFQAIPDEAKASHLAYWQRNDCVVYRIRMAHAASVAANVKKNMRRRFVLPEHRTRSGFFYSLANMIHSSESAEGAEEVRAWRAWLYDDLVDLPENAV
uniref:Nucleoside diphosphate kinase-like domain-containing protein n=1 Tax=Ditylenchus dipsaci TaxID=166011 RepID=A0A915D2Y7_9BILA